MEEENGTYVLNNTAEQPNNSQKNKAEHLAPYQFKKGQSGNPSGRAKGTKSLKEYAKEMLASMNEEERQEFLHGINKVDIWKLAEGNPKQDVGGGEDENGKPIPILVQFLDAKDNRDTN